MELISNIMYLGVNCLLDRIKVVKSVLKLKGPAHLLLCQKYCKNPGCFLDNSLSAGFGKNVCKKSQQCVSECTSHFVHLTKLLSA